MFIEGLTKAYLYGVSDDLIEFESNVMEEEWDLPIS